MNISDAPVGPNSGQLVRQSASGPFLELGSVIEESFTGDVAVLLDRDAWAVYSGPAAAVAFTHGAGTEYEQRVKSYLIPAGTATSVSFAAVLNVTQIQPFDAAFDYLITFAMFSGRVVGTGRQVA